VFTLAGDLITTIQNKPEGYTQGNNYLGEYREDRGEITWDLLSESNRALASGVYIFAINSNYGDQYGKFVLIR
jgi:hypothetical protein